MHAPKTFALVSGILAASLLVVGCGDSVSPERHDPGAPEFSHGGAHPRIFGIGALGPGSPEPTGNRQEFDFDVATDLTGRLFYRDWFFVRADGVTPVSISVDADPATGITAFRNSSAACADPTVGVEFEGIGRTDEGVLHPFTVTACDNGSADPGGDFFMIDVPSVPYNNTTTPRGGHPLIDGSLSSGDIVKDAGGPAPGTGDLSVTTATTGEGIPAGYTVSFSGPQTGSVPIGVNEIKTISGVAFGDYTVGLDMPANCGLVSGTNPRPVHVPDGGIGATSFEVNCTGVAPPPGIGDLTIATATTGEGIPLGYTLNATRPDGSSTTVPFGPTDSQTFLGIAAGDYRLEITDMPANCGLVSGTNPRTVTVPSGGSVSTTFEVNCTGVAPPPGIGDLTIATATTGEGIPPGYTLNATRPDGSSTTVPFDPTDSQTFLGIAASDYRLEITDMPANCGLVSGTGTNPRTVTVPSGGSTSTTFSVNCTPLPGDLRVTTSTTGSSLDPNGYTVTVDPGTANQTGGFIGINNSTGVTFTGLPAGSHTVVLSDVANNCTVSGGPSRQVTVQSGQTVTVEFYVTCVTPNRPPSVNAGADETVLLGLLYTLSASFTDPDNNGPWSYTINWGDGSSSNGTRSSQGTFSASHNYVLIGSYTIQVTVRDNQWASGSDTKVLTVITNLSPPKLPGLP